MNNSNEKNNKLNNPTSNIKIIASIYDKKGKFYLIDKNRDIFLKNKNGNIEKITDKKKIIEIFHLFQPGKSDVIKS